MSYTCVNGVHASDMPINTTIFFDNIEYVAHPDGKWHVMSVYTMSHKPPGNDDLDVFASTYVNKKGKQVIAREFNPIKEKRSLIPSPKKIIFKPSRPSDDKLSSYVNVIELEQRAPGRPALNKKKKLPTQKEPNNYQKYVSEQMKELSKLDPDMDPKTRMTKCGEMWRASRIKTSTSS